jgi:hypothetical protein
MVSSLGAAVPQIRQNQQRFAEEHLLGLAMVAPRSRQHACCEPGCETGADQQPALLVSQGAFLAFRSTKNAVPRSSLIT